MKRNNPMSIRPQIFRKSTTWSLALLAMSQWKNPEKSHFDSIRYWVDDHAGLASLARPS